MEIIDLLMFSINPGYDYHHGDYAIGGADERAALYRRCEAEGVGISVMKAFSGGQLLDAAVSPFGKALTEYQCIQYALDKPGVLTVLAGIRMRRISDACCAFSNCRRKKKTTLSSAASRRRTPPEDASTVITADPVRKGSISA